MLEYGVSLDIDYASNRFQGSVEIRGVEEERSLELDCVGLQVDRVEVGGSPAEYEMGESPPKLRIRPVASDREPIRVHYSAVIAEDLQTGFFVTAVGSQKAFATQMQAESCRRLFPCWDVPNRKAVFRLRVIVQSGLTVISNMTSVARPNPDGRTEWSFAPTPPMSTYLFFLGVGPFEETVDDAGPIPIILAGPAGRTAAARRTLNVARTVLRGYAEYFGVAYPLPKLHFVSLTNFWAGMENWGAISGAEDMYLMGESASPEGLEFSDQVITHEIAHQWFGDLVTLATWDDLWLNEAFATIAVPLVQELTGLRADPWTEFALKNDWGDFFDSLQCTHAVKPDTYVPAEIMANADVITYEKGSRLLRMIRSFIGDDRFRAGITDYLRKHQFGNARSDDLWATLEGQSALPVARVMRSWVERPGHPVVTVRQNGQDVELSQRRFTLLPSSLDEEPWPVPLTVEYDGHRTTTIFDSRRMTLPGHGASSLRLDPERTGFFRILWPAHTRTQQIADLLNASPSNRVGFLKDAVVFLYSGDYAIDEYCTALNEVRSAKDRLTVETVTHQLNLIHPVLWDEPRFLQAARGFLRAQAERLGERPQLGEPGGTGVARQWVFQVRAELDPKFAVELAPRFDAVDSEPAAIRGAIATAFVARNGTDGIDRILARVKGPDPDAVYPACLACQGVTNSKELLEKFWASIQEFPVGYVVSYLIPSLAKNPAGRPALWEWLVDHLRDLERRTTGSFSLSTGLTRSLPLIGIERSRVLREYFAREPFPEALPGISKGLELLEANERLRSRVVELADAPRA